MCKYGMVSLQIIFELQHWGQPFSMDTEKD